jgi:hypothetical protein
MNSFSSIEPQKFQFLFLMLLFYFCSIFVFWRINSTIQIVEHQEALRTSNALEILSQYPWNDKSKLQLLSIINT